MKIGYVMEAGVPDIRQPNASGAAVHVTQTIGELARLGHDVRLVARLNGQTLASDDLVRYRPLDDRRRCLAERVLRRAQAQLLLPYFSYFDSRRFAAACVRELRGFDLLYERMGWMGLGGSRAAGRLCIPHVLEVNGDHQSELHVLGFKSDTVQWRISKWLMGRVARKAAHAVATGEGWRARHVALWHVNPACVSVVQNGTSVVDLIGRQQLRSFRDVESGGPLRVVFAGSFDPWQGVPLLLTAAAKVVESGTELRITLAGSGREEQALREMTRALALMDRVTFVGHLPPPQLAACLSQSDVGVCLYTKRAEYTGLKLLDYKAAGLATVAAGEGRQPELIEHEATGLIIPPNDEGALCAALVRMASSAGEMRAMGRRARLEAEQKHRWAHTAEALARVLREVTSGAAEGRGVGPI